MAELSSLAGRWVVAEARERLEGKKDASGVKEVGKTKKQKKDTAVASASVVGEEENVQPATLEPDQKHMDGEVPAVSTTVQDDEFGEHVERVERCDC